MSPPIYPRLLEPTCPPSLKQLHLSSIPCSQSHRMHSSGRVARLGSQCMLQRQGQGTMGGAREFSRSSAAPALASVQPVVLPLQCLLRRFQVLPLFPHQRHQDSLQSSLGLAGSLSRTSGQLQNLPSCPQSLILGTKETFTASALDKTTTSTTAFPTFQNSRSVFRLIS